MISIASRRDDTFGISYFHYGFSDDLKDSLDVLNYTLDDERGIEAFYNIAVTPWLNITPMGSLYGQRTATRRPSPGPSRNAQSILTARNHVIFLLSVKAGLRSNEIAELTGDKVTPAYAP